MKLQFYNPGATWCCPSFDYTKKHYHPHCCPGKKRKTESCSDHDYPGHFSSVVSYPSIPDRCNKELSYEYYHSKKTVVSNYPWKVYIDKPKYKNQNITKSYGNMHIPNYNKSDCGCGK